jgi:DNA invertase Pin-like site-specific DNA recombinase
MTEKLSVPAAQYLRMSTEHQQYSLQNQIAAIQQYAQSKGFAVIQTYSDAAKSGVNLRRRAGLRELLRDVVGGVANFKAILVYDVSRWGRFQDSDEAAHYEFLCKSAGIPVHYCAETFANDGTMPSLIMKALKRTMAAEYSRELSVKVFEGHKRLALLGFKQGGIPGFGLRRLLVDANRHPKQLLADGERKSIATDRVILVPGPPDEVECVKSIYHMLLSERRSVYGIAGELNRREVRYSKASKWDYLAVWNILTHPKYAGCHVYGRTSQKLYTPSVKLPRDKWTIAPGAYEAIVDRQTFDAAQRLLEGRTINQSDERLLNSLRALLKKEGRLSLALIQSCPHTASPTTYIKRFGSLREAYRRIGYGSPSDFGAIDLRRRTRALREELMEQIRAMFPNEVEITGRGGRWRSRLRVRNRLTVAVQVARSLRTWKTTIRWRIDPLPKETRFVTLLARLNLKNDAVQDLHIFPALGLQNRYFVSLKDAWLKGAERLSDLTQFCEAAQRAGGSHKSPRLGH